MTVASTEEIERAGPDATAFNHSPLAIAGSATVATTACSPLQDGQGEAINAPPQKEC